MLRQLRYVASTNYALILYMLGIFIPELKEFPEMLYQSEMDYVFDSSKFEKQFGTLATPPKEGVKLMVDYFKSLS